MADNKMKFFWRAGVAFALVFTVLLSIRINLFGKLLPAPQTASFSSVISLSERDTWMNISHKDRKIGYSHSTISQTSKGYRLTEILYMRLNTMGMVQDLNLKTQADLHPDLSISSFDFEISSGRFRFAVTGTFFQNILSIQTQNSGSSRKYDIKVKEKPYLAAGIADAVIAEGLRPGETRTFNVFDPATMGQEPVVVRIAGKEGVLNMGRKKDATKVLLTFKGTTQEAWIGEDGEILKEEGLLGIRLDKTSRHDALFGLPIKASQDLTEVVSVPSNVIIEHPEDLKHLKVKIEGISFDRLDLDGGRQRLEGQVLTIEKEGLTDLKVELTSSERTDTSKNIENRFLQPTLFIQSDHEKIRGLAKKIVSEADLPLEKAKKILFWIYKNIEKRPVLSVPDALSTLENRIGDCNEHAILLAALSRAAGIPARIEAGLVYLNGRFYYHAWNLLYVGKWVTADSLFGQIPADITHIRFSGGIPENQLDLIGVVGKVKLTVIEPKPDKPGIKKNLVPMRSSESTG